MTETIQAPLTMIRSVADLRLPPSADRRLQTLMDRNNQGALSSDERDELAALAELSESLSLVRSQALQILGGRP